MLPPPLPSPVPMRTNRAESFHCFSQLCTHVCNIALSLLLLISLCYTLFITTFPLHFSSPPLLTLPPLSFLCPLLSPSPLPPCLPEGPVVCVVPFKTEEEVILRANSTMYGLAASVWSQDMGRLTRVAQALKVRLWETSTHSFVCFLIFVKLMRRTFVGLVGLK